jgi:cardiolipin synthase
MKEVAVPIWVLILMTLAIVSLLVVVWGVKRRKRPHLALEPTHLEDLIPSMSGLTQGTCVKGNKIEILQDGAFWDRLFEGVRSAKETINYETFLCKEGELTARMTSELCAKAKEGVQVRVLLDGSGGKKYGKAHLQQLKDAAVKVHKYHPLELRNLGIINNRDHRKILIVDGRVGFVGGHCLTDNWLGEAQDKKHFRDISVRAEGPVVAQLQSVFAENWIEETGEVTGGTNFFPELEPVGDIDAHAVWLSPAGSPSTVKLLHYMLIHAAKKSITIQNPYFLPDPDAREALIQAAKRGVEVRVMLPSEHASDAPLVQHASHHHFGTLLKHGIRMFDYEKTLLHQKVITIDGCCSAVGSTNFDDRSFEVNDEVSLVIHSEDIAKQLEEIFENDLKHAKERHFDEWKNRPALHKLRDFTSFLFNEQL